MPASRGLGRLASGPVARSTQALSSRSVSVCRVRALSRVAREAPHPSASWTARRVGCPWGSAAPRSSGVSSPVAGWAVRRGSGCLRGGEVLGGGVVSARCDRDCGARGVSRGALPRAVDKIRMGRVRAAAPHYSGGASVVADSCLRTRQVLEHQQPRHPIAHAELGILRAIGFIPIRSSTGEAAPESCRPHTPPSAGGPIHAAPLTRPDWADRWIRPRPL